MAPITKKKLLNTVMHITKKFKILRIVEITGRHIKFVRMKQIHTTYSYCILYIYVYFIDLIAQNTWFIMVKIVSSRRSVTYTFSSHKTKFILKSCETKQILSDIKHYSSNFIPQASVSPEKWGGGFSQKK